VRNVRLNCGRHLRHRVPDKTGVGAARQRNFKDRIITKTAFARALKMNRAFANAFGFEARVFVQTSGIEQTKRATIARAALVFGHVSHRFEQSRHAVGVRAFGPTRRPHAGRAVQSVHFQTRIVGQHARLEMLRVKPGFDARVLRHRVAVLVGRLGRGIIGQGLKFQVGHIAQKFGDFAGFVLRSRGEQNGHTLQFARPGEFWGKLAGMKTGKRFALALIPLALLAVVGAIKWRQIHPVPSAVDRQMRSRLSRADEVRVKIEYFKPGAGPWGEIVAHLAPAEAQSVTGYLNLNAREIKSVYNKDFPIVYLKFYRQGQIQGELATSYNNRNFNYYINHEYAPEIVDISGALHPSSALRLRQLIARHPEITRALLRVGAQPKNLAPKAFVPDHSGGPNHSG